MTRREFIGSVGSAALVAGCEVEDVARLVDDARTDARLGVVANADIGWKESTTTFRKVLRYFRQEGVDAVVVAGGATLNGYKNQFEVLREAWRDVFGLQSKTALILEEGRHEINGFAFGVSARRPSARCEALTFHGRGKKALTNDLWFHDAEVRAVYAGSLNGIVVQAGYEHDARVSDGKLTLPAAQGLLVSAYSSKVVIRRLDFTQTGPAESRRQAGRTVYAEDVADPLVLDRETLTAKETPGVPEFWDDLRLQSFNGYANGRRIVTLKWPHVLKRFRGVRAYRYEVGLHAVPAGASTPHAPYVRRYVLTKNFHLAESRDLAPVSCVFDGEALRDALRQHPALAISVTPVSSLGARGKPVYMRLDQ